MGNVYNVESNFKDWLGKWFQIEELGKKERKWLCESIIVYCWSILKHRNMIVFENKNMNMDFCLVHAK